MNTPLQSDIQESLTTLSSIHFLPAELVKNICEQHTITQSELGLALLPIAAGFAVTPVSGFNVGAVAFDSLGNAYLGANFEFTGVAINQTLHAEQSAIANAWSCGATDLALLVINYAPCGHCRQFINEVNLAANFQIQLPDTPKKTLASYLPNAFGPSDLGIDARILHQTINQKNNTSDLKLAATRACEISHAPYSNNHSGIALLYEGEEIAVGCYGENAAFNPSLSPLQMALNSRRMQGKDWTNIQQVIMAENTTTLTQKHQTEQLLATITKTPITHINHSVN